MSKQDGVRRAFGARRLVVPALMAGLFVSGSALGQDATPVPPGREAGTEVLFQQGRVQYHANQLEQAAASFEQVIAANARDAEAHYYLGLTRLSQERPDAAVEQFNKALELNGDLLAARASRAQALIQLQRLDAAQEDIAALEGRPEWSGTVEYLQGQVQYQQGQYQEAARSFGAARQSGAPEAAAAGLYEGYSYYLLRDYGTAREAFQQTAVLEGASDITATARRLDQTLAGPDAAAKALTARLSIGLEYDSNVVLLPGGVGELEGVSEREDVRLVVQPSATWAFYRTDRVTVGVDTVNYLSAHETLDDYDILSFAAGPFVDYELTENVVLGLQYDFNYVSVGSEEFLTRNTITTQATVKEGDFGFTNAFYQFDARQYKYDPVVDDLDRDGIYNTIGVTQGINLPGLLTDEQSLVTLSYWAEIWATDGDDFDGHAHVLSAVYYTQLPWWGLTADAGLAARFEDYSNGNSLDADNDSRRDVELRLFTGVGKRLNEWLAVRAEYSFTNHESNVATADDDLTSPYDYDRHQVGVRMILSY